MAAQQQNDEEMCDVHVLRKYKLQAKLGKGAYGVVWQAVNKKTKQVVALKKIFGAFQNKTDAQRTFREVILLQEFQHENIIRLLEVMKAMNDKDLYLVFEFMEADLHETIRAGVLSDAHNQYIMYQLLRSINYMHKARVLHRDLKPGNVLINSDCLLKVCDFGLARMFVPKPKPGEGPPKNMMTSRDASSEHETNPNDAASLPMTENIATRWYCAPEILVGSSNYSTGIDMWAIGCILGELLAKKTIFPGNNTVHQLELIVAVTGPPTRSDIESMQCPAARSLLMNIKPSRGISLEKRLKNAPPEALDLLRRLIVFNPDKRLSCAEAMQHPWLRNFYDEKDFDPVVPDIHMIDNQSPTAAHYRKQLYTFIDKMQEELAAKEAREAEARKKERSTKRKSGDKRSSAEVKSASEVTKAGAEMATESSPVPSSPSTPSAPHKEETKEVEKEKKRGTRLPWLPRKGVQKKKKSAAAAAAAGGSPTTPTTAAVSEPIMVKKVGHIGIDAEGNFNYKSLPAELLAALRGEIPADADSAPAEESSTSNSELGHISEVPVSAPISVSTKQVPVKSKSQNDVGAAKITHQSAQSHSQKMEANKSKRISLFFGKSKSEDSPSTKKMPRSRSVEDLQVQ